MVKNFVKGRVSIVTPVYNGETFLSRFLESIRVQTYRNLELILVDDGSSDQTVMVARHWKERLEKEGISMRIVEAPHGNASSAMGYGLPFVSGEYLCWPDSDDVLKETSIEERVEFLEKHPELPLVLGIERRILNANASLKERIESHDLFGSRIFLFRDFPPVEKMRKILESFV